MKQYVIICPRKTALGLLFVLCAATASAAQESVNRAAPQRNRYLIQLSIDFDNRRYTGTEQVRWVNNGERPASTLYFHLYANHRPGPTIPATAEDEPRLEITEVRLATDKSPLTFSIEDEGVSLRVNLRAAVPAGSSTEVVINFKGSVPEIEAEETSLTTHVVKQVSAAIRSDREVRRAREINFRSRGVMLLGAAYPSLSVRNGDDWQRKLDPGVGDLVFNEIADYEVKIDAGAGVRVFTSGGETNSSSADQPTTVASAPALRDFVIIAGTNLRVEETKVGDSTVRSIFLAEHERVGKRVLAVASDSLKIFSSNFGPLPIKTISIAEAPLVAGVGSSEFSGLSVIASAYFVDFDSPAVRNLPEIIREQRPSVEESLEWSVAHLIAHQWWGSTVGNDPSRTPVLDEALASWSALFYFREHYGRLKADSVMDDQLRGVYRLYRTFGGEDMNADRPSRDYRNSFQYAAVVATKGALMFVELQRQLGDDKLLAALRKYYQANMLEVAQLDDLRGALIAEAPVEQRRAVARTFNRWLESRRGDEDIGKPDQELATSLGLPPKPQKNGDRNPLGAFARVGRFFWQQVTRIR